VASEKIKLGDNDRAAEYAEIDGLSNVPQESEMGGDSASSNEEESGVVGEFETRITASSSSEVQLKLFESRYGDSMSEQLLLMAKEKRAGYEDRLLNEPRDPKWSQAQESRLLNIFQSDTPYGAAAVESLTCASTVCKLIAINQYENLNQTPRAGIANWDNVETDTHFDYFGQQNGFRVTVYFLRNVESDDTE
jgi:hypothetical protein